MKEQIMGKRKLGKNVQLDIKYRLLKMYCLYKNLPEGVFRTRPRAWDLCHKAFCDKRRIYNSPLTSENKKKEIIDYLSLHLATYLASWGMLRSSPLRECDYRVHNKTVEEILGEKYNELWDYNPKNYRKAVTELFGGNGIRGIYQEIKDYYSEIFKPDKEREPTDTLITKILLGTFGCVPAYDENVKRAIKNIVNPKWLSGTKSINDKKLDKDSFEILFKIIKDNPGVFEIKGTNYPPMKCLDMYLWEIGK